MRNEGMIEPLLYTLFAYRLPRLRQDLHLRWAQLLEQLGTAEKQTKTVAYRIREVLPDVLAGYPDAKVEVTRHGLLLKPSQPAVPRTMVGGVRLVEASARGPAGAFRRAASGAEAGSLLTRPGCEGPAGDCPEIGGHAASANDGCGWEGTGLNRCPSPEPSAPLQTAQRSWSSRSAPPRPSASAATWPCAG